MTFLLQRFPAVARTNMIIRVHDRFGACTADPDRNKILVHLGFEHPEHHALQVHIYNHTSVQGRGYHFDSLLRQTTVREAEPTVETDARPDATMYSRSTSDNMDGTKKDADRRAEEVFVKLAWRLCRCSFDIPWLEALLLNLLFHGYLSLGPTATAVRKHNINYADHAKDIYNWSKSRTRQKRRLWIYRAAWRPRSVFFWAPARLV